MNIAFKKHKMLEVLGIGRTDWGMVGVKVKWGQDMF